MPITELNGVSSRFPELEYSPEPYERNQAMIDHMANWAHAQFAAGRRGTDFKTRNFDDVSDVLAMIKAGATNWRALRIIYGYKPTGDHWTDFWVGMRNAQAVRNRLKMSEVLLETGLRHRAQVTGRGTAANPLRLLSIAAGSAPGVLNVVAKLQREDIVVKTRLVDLDSSVKGLLEGESRRRKIKQLVSFIPQHAVKYLRGTKDEVDVIEMLGLLDYLSDRLATGLGKLIHKRLAEGGYFLTCHIHPNPEMDFLRYVINWGEDPYMFYRSAAELNDLVKLSGFENRCIYTEPHQIHSICVGQR